ncbi:MAG TPA: ferric reductase-like transmembrane domain-containing protein [Streptosporangiaceae bacterium]|nr:ferric reductase-like transmembrane domain-containing protein [Streptosporangiaceae bacterium]
MASLPDGQLSLAAGHLLAATSYGPSPLWYTARATGVVALILLTITVALGVAGTARLSTELLPAIVRSGLHRNVSLLVVAFIVVHVLSSVLDPFAGIKLTSAIVPFSSDYRPIWLSLGAIAFDMLLALIVTSLLRSRLSPGLWRGVHWFGYVCWPVALWHGLGTGTDSRLSWLLLLEAGCALVVAAAVAWRLNLAGRSLARAAGLAGIAGFALATIVFVAVGPLQPGWARRAGTPASLLSSAHPASAGTSGQTGAGR